MDKINDADQEASAREDDTTMFVQGYHPPSNLGSASNAFPGPRFKADLWERVGNIILKLAAPISDGT